MFNRYNLSRGLFKSLNLNLGAIYTGTRQHTSTTERNEPAWNVPKRWRFGFIVGYSWKLKNGPIPPHRLSHDHQSLQQPAGVLRRLQLPL